MPASEIFNNNTNDPEPYNSRIPYQGRMGISDILELDDTITLVNEPKSPPVDTNGTDIAANSNSNLILSRSNPESIPPQTTFRIDSESENGDNAKSTKSTQKHSSTSTSSENIFLQPNPKNVFPQTDSPADGKDLFTPRLEYRIVCQDASTYFRVNADNVTVKAVNRVSIKSLQTETISLPFELRSPPEGYSPSLIID